MAMVAAGEFDHPEFEETQAPRSNVDYAVKAALGFFLEPRHYQQLSAILSKSWRGCHSLTAALQLIKAHGTQISPDDERRLSALSQRATAASGQADSAIRQSSEDAMIEALVDLMPRDKPELFEHFFLQLSFIASTTQRLRTALESGHADLVAEALESAENVGVLPYLLRMAVVQSGQEVETLEAEHDSWLEATDTKLGPLISTTSEAMDVQKRLSQANSTINYFQAESRAKSRSVLVNLMGAEQEHLLSFCFMAFRDYVRQVKRDEDLLARYENQLKEMQESRMKFRDKSKQHASKWLTLQVASREQDLLAKGFSAFQNELEVNRHMFRLNDEEKALKRQMDAFAESQTKNAESLMGRFSEHSTKGKLVLAFKGLLQNMEEEKHQKALQAELQETKARFSEMQSKQKAFAKASLTSALAVGDAQLVQAVFSNWKQWLADEKAEAERTSAMAQKTSMIKNLTQKSKASSMGAADRVAYLEDQQLLMRCLLTWKRDARCDRLRRLGKEKNEKRKKELVGVKGLFKNFANELETSLTKGTPRVDSPKQLRAGPVAD